ncbi:SGNH hydrolase-type esterase domain-containing protein [Coprinopsis sp. MPI-PUGE-AT-0042]|nr:SGNH hydrolase-type esterase domain-containing protein [Coprinopsis sp. MPI-PUGE-AT-0042]
MVRPLISVLFTAIAFLVCPATSAPPVVPAPKQAIPHHHPLIYYHGRWDSDRGTWWAGSGFKLSVRNLKTLTLNIGEKTSGPFAPTAVSLNDGPFVTYNLTTGANVIDVSGVAATKGKALIRVNVEGWQQNRLQLKGLEINRDAVLQPYAPSKKVFQFVGDSLSSGQFLDQGINQAWPFLVGERFKAEHRINTQPGATLTDMESYGNAHGLSYQFFHTEDTGYFWTSDHNYTTAWDFAREGPKATHVVVHAGANDASHGVTNDDFVKVYTEFLVKLRKLYPRASIFVFTPWGWPNADGNVYYYYQGQYERVVTASAESGDMNVHLVDTTGWVKWEDVFPDNLHLHPAGHKRVADQFSSWLEDWEKRSLSPLAD